MKRLLLCAALLAATQAHAQWGYADQDLGDDLVQLTDQLDRLRMDDDVTDFAGEELAQAEEYIEDLVDTPPHRLEPEDIEAAERLLARVERAAQRRAGGPRRDVVIVEEEVRRGPDRVVIVDDDDARADAERARREADEERERALAAQMEAENARNESARLREALGEAQTRVTDRGVVLTLGDVLFAVGKSDLKPGATRTLDKLVAALRKDPSMTVAIEGHTDSTGRHAYNVGLSQRRAAAVRNYLSSRGISTSRLQAKGLGPDFPVATNATEAGRQQNRRVELVVQNEAMGMGDDER